MAVISDVPHAAVSAHQYLLPALRSFWPTFQQHFAKHGGYLSLTAAKLYYARVDPLHTAIWICAFFSGFVYVTQAITGNASQVDRLWTFLPVIYTIHFTFQSSIAHLLEPSKLGGLFNNVLSKGSAHQIMPRLALITVLQCFWSARLTFHAIRRGFFKSGEEDYRWPIIRKTMSPVVWQIFSFTFIAVTQNILLAMTALPQYMILTSTWNKLNRPAQPADALTAVDYGLAVLTVINLSLEMASDQQQWVFQNYKRGKDSKGHDLPAAKQKALKEEADVKRGFVTRGLWSISRHPNFLFEQINWWLFYGYAVLTFTPTDGPVPWKSLFLSYASLSPLIMNMLFISSTALTEQISGGKYPEYRSYQKRVGMFLPIDTFLRGLYYRLIASSAAREKVEAEVWGDAPLKKAK